LSSEHAEKYDKFATSPHVKYEFQKQVWKGSEERQGKGMRRKNTKKREGKIRR
jgi:hypothetical protein